MTEFDSTTPMAAHARRSATTSIHNPPRILPPPAPERRPSPHRPEAVAHLLAANDRGKQQQLPTLHLRGVHGQQLRAGGYNPAIQDGRCTNQRPECSPPALPPNSRRMFALQKFVKQKLESVRGRCGERRRHRPPWLRWSILRPPVAPQCG